MLSIEPPDFVERELYREPWLKKKHVRRLRAQDMARLERIEGAPRPLWRSDNKSSRWFGAGLHIRLLHPDLGEETLAKIAKIAKVRKGKKRSFY